jgi:2-C-methyl-D-erythritol 4-phosphate cytidylyltransferase
MKTEVIVAAAGAGKRLRSKTRKPYLRISEKPLLIHTLQALSRSPDINKIIVVVNRSDKNMCKGLIKAYGIRKIKSVIAGGHERVHSVKNGIDSLDKDTDMVLIHDGVRPFIDDLLIKRSIDCARRYGACVVGVPVKATVKRVHLPSSIFHLHYLIDRTIDRRNLWVIQTPQVFRKDIIVKAYKKFGKIRATDDAVLAERMGVKVRVVKGSYRNIKITTPEDLIVAEAIYKKLCNV